MKSISYLALLIAFFTLFVSCEKDKLVSVSTSETTASELKKAIEDRSVDRIFVLEEGDAFPNAFPSSNGDVWSFSNGFIKVNYKSDQSFNLLYLKKYNIFNVQLDNGSSAVALILYF